MKETIIGAISLLIPSLIAASYWLVRIYIPKKIEAQVNYQYNLKLEEFKSHLTVVAAERQLRFSHIYVKTAEVIQTYYKQMTDTRTALFLVLSDLYNQESLLQAAEKAQQELEKFLIYDINNGLYIPPDCEKMVSEMRHLLTILMDAIEIKMKMEGEPPGDAEVWKKKIQSNVQEHKEKFEKLHPQLKHEFQKLIGVVIS